ncbi:MAG TPA: glycosyl hydrolase, partial [Bacteroidales bacterium]|nr:glycosyl hydrolase [Bacteroidales bacterium]
IMNLETLECIDITDKVTRNGFSFRGKVPRGEWKVMLFYLDSSRRRGVCDYLSEKAVAGLIDVMYNKYYENLKEYFGTMIKQVFYDEPSMHNSVSGRLWTPGYNEGFIKKYGYSPMKYYPALWYDIGEETASARNALYGYRTELYTENFIGQIAKWCEEKGVALSGHMDQEEAPNPVGTVGDLMKIFKYQQIPTIDDIWFTGRSNTSYKIVTSAAFNFDRPVIQAETYAAYQPRWQNAEAAWRTALDQHAMGINQQTGWRPRAVESPEMGQFIGRTQYLLRGGRHVADIAMLYPVATLQAKYKFAHPTGVEPVTGGPARKVDAGFYYALEGGIVTPENNYMEMGEMLFRGMQTDYTYIHPEILSDKCIIENGQLTIDNKVNRESFRVLILPGCETISLKTAQKVKEFYLAGGTVIATTLLPKYSAESGKDREVQKIMGEIFGIPEYGPMKAAIRAYTDDFKTYFAYRNDAGGKSYFLPRPDPKMVTDVLNEALPVRDVRIQMEPVWPVRMNMKYDGAVTYIHKVKDGKDIYFIANSTNEPVKTSIILRGKKNLALWDPHTGEREDLNVSVSEAAGQSVTTVPLSLGALKSVFYIEQ